MLSHSINFWHHHPVLFWLPEIIPFWFLQNLKNFLFTPNLFFIFEFKIKLISSAPSFCPVILEQTHFLSSSSIHFAFLMDNDSSLKTTTTNATSNGHFRKSALKSSNGQKKAPDTGHSCPSPPLNASTGSSGTIFSLVSRKSSTVSTSPTTSSTSSTQNTVITSTMPSNGIFISAITILSRSKYYLSSLRPGSFVTSLIPVLLGALLAGKTTGQFSIVILGATVLTVISVHAAGNLVNTYCDFVRGIDSQERRSDDRTLVDSILTPEEVVHLGVLFYLIGCIGFLIVVLTSPARMELLALMYFCGISSSFLYTGGGFKYIALGDILIMVTFGPVSVLYSFIAQTGTIRLVTLLYAIPLALNAEAILHSNNTRDIEDDRKAGCVTIAVLIGPSASHVLFALLLFTPYILFIVVAFHYSLWLLLPVITLPWAFQLEKQFRNGNLRSLPKQMARLNIYFGMFYLLACLCSQSNKLPGLFQFWRLKFCAIPFILNRDRIFEKFTAISTLKMCASLPLSWYREP